MSSEYVILSFYRQKLDHARSNFGQPTDEKIAHIPKSPFTGNCTL